MTMKLRLALASLAVVLLVAAALFLARPPRSESPRTAEAEPSAAAGEPGGAALSAAEGPATEAARRSPVAQEPPVGLSAAPGTNVLRVVLEGITEEDAQMARVTVTGVDGRALWPRGIQDSWPCQGRTSEFDLDPFFESLAQQQGLHVIALEVEVDHPLYFPETVRVPPSSGEELASDTAHEVRVRLARPEFWPEFTLAVRDAHTRAHLEDVELRIMPGPWMAGWGSNPPSSPFGSGLKSPIALMGGREAGEPQVTLAGFALVPPAGASPRPVSLVTRLAPEHGVHVLARAPGHAWGSITFDVSVDEDRELLLEPGSTLAVRLTNMQLERYAAIEAVAVLCVYWIREDGGNQYVRFERLDETLETEGLRLEGLVPGGYRVAVELGGGSWPQRPVLARQELSLAAGDSRELVLALEGPPVPLGRATLGGVVSLPAFGAEEEVKMHVYHESNRGYRDPEVELSLDDLEAVGGTLPTWSFRVEDLPVGLYQVQLVPFMKSWMIELPPEGREDVELVLPELAELLVETVDARTGERVAVEEFFFRHEEVHPNQMQNHWCQAETEEPGRFRIWTAPGPASIWPLFPDGLEYGRRWEDHVLVSGLQSVRFELEPLYAIRIEFREGGVELDRFDDLWGQMRPESYRAVGHEGELTSFGYPRVEVNAPGLYEVSFEGVGADRFLPLPPQLVEVRPGETAQVIVELRRK